MMCNMEFFPGLGLGKDQQGLPGFVDPETPRLKHGIGFGEEEGPDIEVDIWDQFEKEDEDETKAAAEIETKSKEKVGVKAEPAKEKEKVQPKEKTLWETFTGEGEGYLYAENVKPVTMAGRMVPGFEIFSKFMNGLKWRPLKRFLLKNS